MTAVGARKLYKLQLGKEDTPGSAVAATTVWRGTGRVRDTRMLGTIPENLGIFPGVNNLYEQYKAAACAMPAEPATFEQIGYVLNAGIHGATGVRDGVSGSGYVYEYVFPVEEITDDIYTYTIEGGDDQRVDEMDYSFVKRFSLKGSPKEALSLSSDWVGRKATDSSFTAALSVPAVEPILFSKGKLYIDAESGTVGTTAVSHTWAGFELNVNTGWLEKWSGDGSESFAYHVHVGSALSGTLIVRHDATGAAEITAARSRATRLVRMLFESPTALTTPGSYNYKTFQIDMAIRYKELPDLGNQDGLNTVPLPFDVVYSAAEDLYAEITLVNELSALP